jgi:hypothetical protein
MFRVAGAINLGISPATWTAALVVVAGWVAGALFIANHIASTPQPLAPQKVLAQPEASQTSNRAAKAAREPFKQARLAPDPSILSAPRQTAQDEPALEPPQDAASDEASLRDTLSDDAGQAQGSWAAAEELGMIRTGTARVSVSPVDDAVVSASAGGPLLVGR